jgi:hypothetical protein
MAMDRKVGHIIHRLDGTSERPVACSAGSWSSATTSIWTGSRLGTTRVSCA